MMDHAYYKHDDEYIKSDISQNDIVHAPTHYAYPAIPPRQQLQLPLSPQSINHNPLTTRTSLSDIDEALESAMMSPTLESHAEQQQELEQTFNMRIPHPELELLPDNGVYMPRQSASFCLQDFIVQRTLGTGSFGRVHLVRSKHNARFYAIKVLSKEKVVNTKQVEHTKSERALLAIVRHPFIVTLWGTFQDSENLYMIMDFIAGGELFSLLRKSKRFPDPVAKFYAAEVALALHYLHTLDIVYRDLKPENILLSSDGHIKLTDFGFAKHLPPSSMTDLAEQTLPPDSEFLGFDTGVTWTLCGTPDYLAPEIVKGQPYGMSVDWYALGVLIFEMLAGYPPFFVDPTYDPTSTNPVSLYQRIAVGLPSVNFPMAFNHLATDIIHKFMTADVSERFGNMKHGVEDIFAHSWFSEVNWRKLLRREITAPYIPTIVGDGDASQFEPYQEINLPYLSASQVGHPPSLDPYGYLFSEFEYTTH